MILTMALVSDWPQIIDYLLTFNTIFMKKILFTMLALLALTPVFAQKTSIMVGNVESPSGINSRWAQTLKNQIISGLAASQRLEVADANSFSGLSSNQAEAISQLRAAGIDCYVTARIDSFTGKSEYSNGKTWYKSTLGYSVIVINNATGATLGTYNTTHYGSSTEGSDAAYADAFSLVTNDMKKLINRAFRISGEIKSLQDVNPKKGVKTLYINVGSDVGVEAGNVLSPMMFDVFKEVEIAGETIQEEIGSLKVKEVKSGTLSLCTVTKGGMAIQEAFEAGLKLTVVSRPPAIEL